VPLIDITMKTGLVLPPDYQEPYPDHKDVRKQKQSSEARAYIRHNFARMFAESVYRNASVLGLARNTPASGIQVMNHEFDNHDLNVPDVWVKVQFSERRPWLQKRRLVRDFLYAVAEEWFEAQGYTPKSFVIDVFWGPTHGKGVVNGDVIEW